ncbi:unnamed protein product [marine sediment metagenome]|uniref:HTH arsR-type domain-containing protein n=1 Tax=marine sediment metagenome TaxID=412755 RepID=X0VJ04_9ZZZZ
MAQEQILKLLMDNPGKRFTVYDIAYSIRGGIERRIAHKNLKSLEKMDCIKKEGEKWYYVK